MRCLWCVPSRTDSTGTDMSQTSSRPKRRIAPRLLLIGGGLFLMIGAVLVNVLLNRPASRSGLAVTGADPKNAQLVAQGRLVYAAQCASCHGADLEGQPNWRQPRADGTMPAPPHDATGHTWHHNDQSLFTTVRRGGLATAPEGYRSAMPAFPQLSDEDIWAVLAYIKSSWPAEIQQAQQQGHQ